MSPTVVVGAGVVGLACGVELQRRGVRVSIVERRSPRDGASWANLGWIVPSFSEPLPSPGLVTRALRWMSSPGSPLYIRPGALPTLAGWLWRFRRHCNERDHRAGIEALAELNRHTMALFDRWVDEDGIEVELHRSGLLMAYRKRARRDRSLAALRRIAEEGFPEPRALERDDVRELEPLLSEELGSGILLPGEWHVRPESLVEGLERRFLEEGGEILGDREVVGGGRRNGKLERLRTREGEEIPGERIILAAGARTGLLARSLGFRLPVEAGKGYTLTRESPALELRRPVYIEDKRLGITPYRGALRIGGTMELSGMGEETDSRRVAAIRRGAEAALPAWKRTNGGEGAPEERVWMGMRALTPDGLPAVGRAPGYDNVFVATGHGMLGMTLAPATGKALAEVLTEGAAETDLSPFDPGRFRS